MKILRKTDIESMERELSVLQNPEKILGGTSEPITGVITGAIDGGTLPEVVVTGVMPPGTQVNGMSYADVSAFINSLKTSFIKSLSDEGPQVPGTGMIEACINNMIVDCVNQLWGTGYSGGIYLSMRDLTPGSVSPTYDMRIYAEDGTRIAYSNNCGGDYWPW